MFGLIDMQCDFIADGSKPLPNVKESINKLNEFVKSLGNIKGIV